MLSSIWLWVMAYRVAFSHKDWWIFCAWLSATVDMEVVKLSELVTCWSLLSSISMSSASISPSDKSLLLWSSLLSSSWLMIYWLTRFWNRSLDWQRSSSVCLVDQQPSFLQTKHFFVLLSDFSLPRANRCGWRWGYCWGYLWPCLSFREVLFGRCLSLSEDGPWYCLLVKKVDEFDSARFVFL